MRNLGGFGSLYQQMKGAGMANQQSGSLANMYGQYMQPVQLPLSHCAICGTTELHTTDQCKKPQTTKENKTMYDAVKTWFNKHSDLLVTVAAIFLADHFLFAGKFRHKIEQMVDGLIDKVAKKVEAHEA